MHLCGRRQLHKAEVQKYFFMVRIFIKPLLGPFLGDR
jgi:hypothetical protein